MLTGLSGSQVPVHCGAAVSDMLLPCDQRQLDPLFKDAQQQSHLQSSSSHLQRSNGPSVVLGGSEAQQQHLPGCCSTLMSVPTQDATSIS